MKKGEADALDAPGAGRRAARGGTLRVAAFLAGQLVTLGAIALLFRHLGVAGSGRYVTVLSLVAIVGGLTDLGLTTLATRELALADEVRRRALLGELLGLRLAATIAGVFVAIAFAAAAGYTRSMVAGTALVGLALMAQNATSALTADLVVRLRGGLAAASDLARQLVAAGLIALGVALDASLTTFFALLIPASLAGLLVAVSAVRARPVIATGAWRSLLKETIPFAVAAAASVLFFRVTMIEMSLLSSARQTGLFAASFRVVEVLSVVPALAVGTLFPVLSRAAARDPARFRAEVARALKGCAIAGVVVTVALAAAASPVIDVIAGSHFHGAATVLHLQSGALLFSFLAAPPAFALLAMGRARALMWANVIGVAVAIGVAAALIDAHGARGAALATVIGEAGLAATFWALYVRNLPQDSGETVPGRGPSG